MTKSEVSLHDLQHRRFWQLLELYLDVCIVVWKGEHLEVWFVVEVINEALLSSSFPPIKSAFNSTLLFIEWQAKNWNENIIFEELI